MPFRLKDQLGSGGQGSVWKAELMIPDGTAINRMEGGFPEMQQGRVAILCPCPECSGPEAATSQWCAIRHCERVWGTGLHYALKVIYTFGEPLE